MNKKSKQNPPVSHAVVIVGIDTTDPDPNKHYLLVKNSYDVDSGEGGFSRIGFEAIYFLIVPEFDLDKIMQLHANEKNKVNGLLMFKTSLKIVLFIPYIIILNKQLCFFRFTRKDMKLIGLSPLQ